MLACRLHQRSFAQLIAKKGFHRSSVVLSEHGGGGDIFWGYERAQGREYVGFGLTGSPDYSDRLDKPYPAIRFKKDDAEILALREKERGDWNKLTMEEKKKLYRASFCATYAEFFAPTGHWKLILSALLVGLSVAFWMAWGVQKFVWKGRLPPTVSEEHREAQLQRMIDLHMEPITGYASKWDYEKGRWKK